MPRSADPNAPSGIVLVDKPGGITSHDVVSRVRRAAGTRKVGHAGTLDPMATGLLVLGVERATRLLTYLVGLGKVYEATILLGAATDTDDAEGEAVERHDASGVADAAIAAGVARLTGEIEQVPSTYSAIKVDGRRAYDLARSGEQVELRSRAVTVAAFDVLATRRAGETIELDVRVACSSGTYIRALARDLGRDLGVGGHLTALRRTAVGPFSIADAAAPDERVLDGLLPSADVASRLFPTIALTPEQAVDVGHGKRVGLDHADADLVAALAPDGRLLALVRIRGGASKVVLGMPEGGA